MLTTNANYQTRNLAISKRPIYVAEIFFNYGNTGTDGTNDVYFATADVNDITGFSYPNKWFPFLKSDSISSISQAVDPINGVSTIGGLDLVVTDYAGKVSDIIKAADTVGHGLRRQRISIHVLYKGMAWADKVTIRTMQINDVRLTSLNEYKITCADVQRQLQKTVFNPYSTTLSAAITTTGAITASVVDARNFTATTQQSYGTKGFIRINDEIMMWDSKTDTSFVISAGGRGMFGTIATTHASGDAIQEIIVLRENPITMALKIMESGSGGTYDAYPTRWGCGMDAANDVDETEWLAVGKLLTGLSATPAPGDGIQFEFVIDKSIEAKKFIEDKILKILGAFGFVHGDGKYGIKAYSDLSNAAKENGVLLDQNAVSKWGDLTYKYNDIANQVWIEYDESPKLSGRYIRNAIFIDDVSVKKWGQARQLQYTADGVIPTSIFASQLYQRFQRIIARYSRPPMQIQLTLLPKYHTLEIGDIVRVSLPIRDLFTGTTIDRAFEVISTKLTPSTGEVVINCIAQPEKAALWFGGVGEVSSVTISPATVSVVTGSTFQLTARAFDGVGNQVQAPAISWVASGNVSVNSSGLVTAGAVGSGSVYAVVGDKTSNTASITVTATANTNPVASIVISPSAVAFAAGESQQMTAVAYDSAGSIIEGATFTWASSNTGVATIPAGPSASATLTAVANGTSNITATSGAIVSSVVVATVRVPETPTYTPPAILDSAYQIGTKLTAATHPTIISGAAAPYTFVNGANIPAGDYWIDGDISLATGNTITINRTVRLFCLGTVTINGVIDGKGRGYSGGASISASGNGLPSISELKGFVGSINVYGQGSNGGNTIGRYGGLGSIPSYKSAPTLTINPTSVSGSSWVGVSGIPTDLSGSYGASGGGDISGPLASITTGSGGNAGAGLMIMSRGIYVVTGTVDLRGNAGGDGYANISDRTYFANGAFAAGGGGGSGGSFIALAERNVNGLPVMSVLASKILVSGGTAGRGAADYKWLNSWNYAPEDSGGIVYYTAKQIDLNQRIYATAGASDGGTGAIITQVIG